MRFCNSFNNNSLRHSWKFPLRGNVRIFPNSAKLLRLSASSGICCFCSVAQVQYTTPYTGFCRPVKRVSLWFERGYSRDLTILWNVPIMPAS
jgi:hypothetical protein